MKARAVPPGHSAFLKQQHARQYAPAPPGLFAPCSEASRPAGHSHQLGAPGRLATPRNLLEVLSRQPCTGAPSKGPPLATLGTATTQLRLLKRRGVGEAALTLIRPRPSLGRETPPALGHSHSVIQEELALHHHVQEEIQLEGRSPVLSASSGGRGR